MAPDPSPSTATGPGVHPGDGAASSGPSATLAVAIEATALLGARTGVGVMTAGVIDGLARRPDVDLTAFAVSWRRRQGISEGLARGVTVSNRAMPARPLRWSWGRGPWPPVEWFVGRQDVVHGTNFTVPPTRGAARVLTVHDLTPVRFPELCDPASLAYPAQIRAALSAGAWIHTPSTYVAQEVIEAFGADPARVRAVASGTPGPLERLARSESRSSAPAVLPTPVVPTPALPTSVLAASELPNGVDRYVLAVGTAEPRKDLPGLVGAFDRLAGGHPELALVLAGPDGWGTAALDSAVAQAIHRNRIVRTGWVDDRILDGLLAGAALLAYPSVYEGFGFPPLQAMAAGVPVVATRAGALPEVLGDAALLVPVGQPDALADAMARVLDDPVLAASLVAKGRLRAAGFTWDRCAQGLVELYRDAVADRR